MTSTSVTSEGNVGTRAFHGSIWNFLGRTSQLVISLLQVAVLGRLIAPAEFGVMGLASLATQAIAVFVYTGYEFALVQKSDLIEDDIHSAWAVMLLRKVAIGLVLGALSYPIVLLYKAPQALPILLAMAAIQPISGLASPAPNLLQKELKYKKLFSLSIYSSLFGLVVGVLSAFLLKNVWALFFGTLANTIASVFLSYFFHPYRPKWKLNRKSIASLSNYGKWMFGSAILWFVFSQGTDAFSGWLFGTGILGLYQMASRFALMPCTQIGDVILGTVFPVYSLMQDDPIRAKNAFLRVLSVSGIVILGASGLIAWGLPAPFLIILGSAWKQSAELIPLIACTAGIRAMLRTGSPLYLGMGKPKYQFYMDLVQTSLMILLLYPLGKLVGLYGLPFAAMIGAICSIPIWWNGIQKVAPVSFSEVVRALLPSISGLLIIRIVYALGHLPGEGGYSSWTVVSVYTALAILASGLYAGNMVIWDKFGYGYQAVSDVLNILGKFKFTRFIFQRQSR